MNVILAIPALLVAVGIIAVACAIHPIIGFITMLATMAAVL